MSDILDDEISQEEFDKALKDAGFKTADEVEKWLEENGYKEKKGEVE